MYYSTFYPVYHFAKNHPKEPCRVIFKNFYEFDESTINEIYKINHRNSPLSEKEWDEFVRQTKEHNHMVTIFSSIAQSPNVKKEWLIELNNSVIDSAILLRDDLTLKDINDIIGRTGTIIYTMYIQSGIMEMSSHTVDTICGSVSLLESMNYTPLALLTTDCDTYKNINSLFDKVENKEMMATVLIGNNNLPEKFKKEIADKYGYCIDSWVKLPSFAIQEAYMSIAETIFNPEFITEISLRTEAKKSMRKLLESENITADILFDYIERVKPRGRRSDYFCETAFQFAIQNCKSSSLVTKAIKEIYELPASSIMYAPELNMDGYQILLARNDYRVDKSKKTMQLGLDYAFLQTLLRGESYKGCNNDVCMEKIYEDDKIAMGAMMASNITSALVTERIFETIENYPREEQEMFNAIYAVRCALDDYCSPITAQYLSWCFFHNEINEIYKEQKDMKGMKKEVLQMKQNQIDANHPILHMDISNDIMQKLDLIKARFSENSKQKHIIESFKQKTSGILEYINFSKKYPQLFIQTEEYTLFNTENLIKEFRDNPNEIKHLILDGSDGFKQTVFEQLNRSMAMQPCSPHSHMYNNLAIDTIVELKDFYKELTNVVLKTKHQDMEIEILEDKEER